MGLLDFLRRRRERERLITELEITPEPVTDGREWAPANARDIADARAGGADLGWLAGIASLIAEASRTNTIRVLPGSPRRIELGGAELQQEIVEIVRRHGFEPRAQSAAELDTDAATAASEVDPEMVAAMQSEILAAIGRHGIDLSAHLGDHGRGGSGE